MYCSRYPSYEKVYYSRKQFKKAKGTEIGENILLDLFSKNGFTIISPEQLTLDEQIAVVRNTKLLFCGHQRLAIEDDDVNHHIIFKQKTADRVDSYFERLILWIAEDSRGDQRECDRLATMLLCERE